MQTIIILLLFLWSKVKCDIAEEYILGSVKNIDKICSQLNKASISDNCAEQLNEACGNRTVLVTLLDATSKFPYSGLLEGTRLDLGDFDQCINLDHGYQNHRIVGKYCLGGLVLIDPVDPTNSQKSFKLATCIPNRCDDEDFNRILRTFYPNLTNVVFTNEQCTTKEKEDLGSAPEISLYLIALTVFLMIVSTIYDYCCSEKPSNKPLRVILAFSVIHNGRKLFQTSKDSKEEITIFYGLKFISALWIIAFHSSSILSSYSLMNSEDVTNFSKKLYSFYILSAPAAVDTFFYISGFLLAYLYLKIKMSFASQIISIPRSYLHRYMRITPAAFMLWLSAMYVIPQMGSGPFRKPSRQHTVDQCLAHALAYFSYIQNYNNYDDMCLTHTWYLSAEMQLYFFSPIVIIPLAAMVNNRRYELAMKFLMVLNIFFTFFPIVIKSVFWEYDNPYNTHSRVIAYTIGITMGTYMRQKKHKPFLNSRFSKRNELIFNLLVWITVLLAMPAMLICLHTFKYNHHLSCIIRPVWCICLSWMVYSCYHGFGGIVNWLLTRPFMQVGGKISYSIYLVHVLVMGYNLMVTRTRIYGDDYVKFHMWCSFLVISIIASMFWTLAYEYPMISIDRILYGPVYGTNNIPIL